MLADVGFTLVSSIITRRCMALICAQTEAGPTELEKK